MASQWNHRSLGRETTSGESVFSKETTFGESDGPQLSSFKIASGQWHYAWLVVSGGHSLFGRFRTPRSTQRYLDYASRAAAHKAFSPANESLLPTVESKQTYHVCTKGSRGKKGRRSSQQQSPGIQRSTIYGEDLRTERTIRRPTNLLETPIPPQLSCRCTARALQLCSHTPHHHHGISTCASEGQCRATYGSWPQDQRT